MSDDRPRGTPTHSSASARRPLRRILIAEDETLLARALQDSLRSTHEVVLAEHGAEALRVIDESGAGVDLVLSDVHMPWVNGIELHRAIAARGSPLAARFLLMSGSPLSPAHASYVEAAGLTVLSKPFRLELLEHALASLGTTAAERRKSG